MNNQQQQRDTVQTQFDQWYGTQMRVALTDDQIERVIGTGISILDEMEGKSGAGGFVRAVVDNDLVQAHLRADSTNLRVLYFYVLLKVHATK